MNERIKITDSTISAVAKMSDGNPGALTALMEILNIGAVVDPDSFMGAMYPVLMLDSMAIYGTDIYVLWSDVCGRDTILMIAVFRAFQLGFISEDVIKAAAGVQDRSGADMIDCNDLYKKVCEALPNFDKEHRG